MSLPSSAAPVELTLYSRSYCHLCDDFLAAMEVPLAAGIATVRIVDVDSDPALELRYGDRVPVLALSDEEICEHLFDPARLREVLARLG